jgi:hypothetical protein
MNITRVLVRVYNNQIILLYHPVISNASWQGKRQGCTKYAFCAFELFSPCIVTACHLLAPTNAHVILIYCALSGCYMFRLLSLTAKNKFLTMLYMWMYRFNIVCLLVLGGGAWLWPHPGQFTFINNPVVIVLEDEWAPWWVWTSLANLATTGVLSTELLARNKSLYHLRYPGPHNGI